MVRNLKAPGPQYPILSLHSQLEEGKSLPPGTPGTCLYTPPNNNYGSRGESLAPLDFVRQYRPTEETSTRRRLPEPIETISSSCQRENPELGPSSHQDSSATGLRPRRFAPQLLETASRSFRKDTPPANCHNSQAPGIASHSTPYQENVARPQSSDDSRLCRQERPRRHSFRIPDLPTIPSSCSGDSSDSELPSLSPSASSNGLEKQPKTECQRRESCDEHISQYLLSLAARSAKTQLKDQTLTTFPNEEIHQPIDHFSFNTEDDAHLSDKGPVRKEQPAACQRTSSTDLSWELEYTPRHREKAEVSNQDMLDSPIPTMAAQQILNTSTEIQTPADGDEQYDVLGARPTSPPLLGDDLIFPQSLSPQGTRNINGNIASQSHGYFDQLYQPSGGLWCANLHVVHGGGGGLWMGTCHKEGERDGKSLFQGPITSANGHQDVLTYPDALVSYEDANQISYNPSINDREFDDTSRRFNAQDDLEKEVNDGFVTQIYNYLSLGYPCVARHYDHELSEFSSMSVKELQQDDLHTDDKGYVGIFEGTAGNTMPSGCISMRWMALRLYIQEWVKRQPRMAGNLEASSVCERRGSWAG